MERLVERWAFPNGLRLHAPLRFGFVTLGWLVCRAPQAFGLIERARLTTLARRFGLCRSSSLRRIPTSTVRSCTGPQSCGWIPSHLWTEIDSASKQSADDVNEWRQTGEAAQGLGVRYSSGAIRKANYQTIPDMGSRPSCASGDWVQSTTCAASPQHEALPRFSVSTLSRGGELRRTRTMCMKNKVIRSKIGELEGIVMRSGRCVTPRKHLR